MPADAFAHAASLFATPPGQLPLPALARILSPDTVQTPALDLVDTELERTLSGGDNRLIVTMSPQEGKSSRVTVYIVRALLADPTRRIVLSSYAHDLARRNARAVRDALVANPGWGLSVRLDVASQAEWEIAGHGGGVFAAGIGTALAGRPADMLVIDDPIKDREQADSAVYRERVWDWWTEVAAARLAPGAPVIVVSTRWHTDDLVGRLLTSPGSEKWRVLNIAAQADHDPAKGEVDPLGREPEEFMVSARGRTPEQWSDIKLRSGSRTWAALYQGRPSPAGGAILKRDWWQRYSSPMFTIRPDGTRHVPGRGIEVIQSWDMAFKDTKASDYVVGQVWLRRGTEAFLLDQVRARMSFVASCAALRDLSAKWPQAVTKLVEDKANGPAVLDALRREVGGLIAVEPRGSKEARVHAVSPFIEAGNVFLPADAPWVGDFLEESSAFPLGRNDDSVDAMSQALHRLLLHYQATTLSVAGGSQAAVAGRHKILPQSEQRFRIVR